MKNASKAEAWFSLKIFSKAVVTSPVFYSTGLCELEGENLNLCFFHRELSLAQVVSSWGCGTEPIL